MPRAGEGAEMALTRSLASESLLWLRQRCDLVLNQGRRCYGGVEDSADSRRRRHYSRVSIRRRHFRDSGQQEKEQGSVGKQGLLREQSREHGCACGAGCGAEQGEPAPPQAWNCVSAVWVGAGHCGFGAENEVQ